MFPIDLDGLFPKQVGEKHERSVSLGNRIFHITVSCSDKGKYDLLVIDRDTNEEYLRSTGLQEDIIQFNWKFFRDNGFLKTAY